MGMLLRGNGIAKSTVRSVFIGNTRFLTFPLQRAQKACPSKIATAWPLVKGRLDQRSINRLRYGTIVFGH